MFWAEIWKISEFFIWKFSVFGSEISIYLNRRVFVMCHALLSLKIVKKNIYMLSVTILLLKRQFAWNVKANFLRKVIKISSREGTYWFYCLSCCDNLISCLDSNICLDNIISYSNNLISCLHKIRMVYRWQNILFGWLNVLFTQENKLFTQDVKSSKQLNYLIWTTLYFVHRR